MNDHSLNDPALESLEARMAALAPRLPDCERQELLFQCGLAAGRNLSARRTRQWQAVSALLGVLLLGLSIPLAAERLPIAWRKPAAPLLSEPQPTERDPEFPQLAPRIATVSLDAWQRQDDTGAVFAQHLAKFRQTDPALRSLAVGMMSQAANPGP